MALLTPASGLPGSPPITQDTSWANRCHTAQLEKPNTLGRADVNHTPRARVVPVRNRVAGAVTATSTAYGPNNRAHS